MGNEVTLVGRAELENIYKSLKRMSAESKKSAEEMSNFAKHVQENLDKQTKNTENNVKKTGSALRRLAGQLYSDFKALMSLESLQGALKLTSQFKGAISESITLADTIRRVGHSFGIATKDFSSFHSSLSKGLGNIGASSESTARALEGLTGLGVKGEGSIMNMTKGAVTLAGMSGEKGGERNIAQLLGKVIQAQGKDVNDRTAQNQLIGEVTAATKATGKQASEILGAMDQIFSSMDKSLRGKIGPEGMAQMATIAATVGPNATKALQEYLGKSSIARMGMEAQGFNIVGKGGQIDMKALKSFIETTRGRVGGDPRASLMTAGFSEEAAEGLIRMADQSALVEENLNGLAKATRDNEQAFRESMGLLDSFKGTINTVKGTLEKAFAPAIKGLTDVISSQVGDTAGSAVVVGGAATLAAILAGGGLRGVGKQMLGGELKKRAYEGITGEEVQNVYVVNAAEIAGASALPGVGGKMAGIGGKLMKGAGVLGAGAAGYALGDQLINPLLDKFTTKTDESGFTGNAIERFFAMLDRRMGGNLSGTQDHQFRVLIETKEPNLRAVTKPSRGGNN